MVQEFPGCASVQGWGGGSYDDNDDDDNDDLLDLTGRQLGGHVNRTDPQLLCLAPVRWREEQQWSVTYVYCVPASSSPFCIDLRASSLVMGEVRCGQSSNICLIPMRKLGWREGAGARINSRLT